MFQNERMRTGSFIKMNESDINILIDESVILDVLVLNELELYKIAL